MSADLILLTTSIAEHLVIFFHGMKIPVAFAFSFFIQVAWAWWGLKINDALFVVTGITSAILNAHFHLKKDISTPCLSDFSKMEPLKGTKTLKRNYRFE